MDKTFNKNFLKGVLSSSLGTASTIIFHFLSITVIVRHVSMHDFGIYMLLLAIVNGLRIFAGLGLDLTLVKFISAENKASEQHRIFLTTLLVRLVATFLLGALVYLFGHWSAALFDESIRQYLGYLPILCLLSSLKELLFSFLQGTHRFKSYAVINALSAAAKLLIILLPAMSSQLSLQGLIYAEIASLAMCLGMQLFAMPFAAFRSAHFHRGTSVQTLKFGFPLYLNSILTFGYDRANTFMIGAMLNPVNIALYEAATKIPEGLQRLFNSYIAVYFPSLSKLFAGKHTGQVEQVMNRSLILLSSGGIFLALGAFLFKTEIIQLLFSKDYLPAATAFALLMVDVQIIMIGYSIGYSLVSAGHSALPFKINTVTLALNLIGNWLLLPRHGFLGAVASSLIAHTSAALLNYFYLRKTQIILNLINYLKPLFLFLLIIGMIKLFDLNAIYQRVFLMILYVAGCAAFYEELRSGLLAITRSFRVSIPKPDKPENCFNVCSNAPKCEMPSETRS